MKNIAKLNLLSVSLLLVLTFIFIYITNKYILTVNFYENSGDPLAGVPSQEIEVYNNLQKWIFLTSAVYLLLKFALTSLVIYMGFYLSGCDLALGKIFHVVVLSELIFFVPAIIKMLWFYKVHPAGTLMDWHLFYPLSAITLFKDVPADWYYPLQIINIFEVIYWFLLAYGLSGVAGVSFDRSLRIVLTAYLPALFIWVATVTFCCLMLFPATA